MKAPIENRRRTPRAKLSVPFRIRFFDPNCPEEIGKTSDVSREGLYFETSARGYLEQFFQNRKVGVIRNFQPGELLHLEETGQIMRVYDLPDGKLGVSIHILQGIKPEITKVHDSSNAKT
jgi:hypothetical protein